MTEKQGDTGKYGKIMEVTGANMEMLCRQYMDELPTDRNIPAAEAIKYQLG